MNEFQSFRLKMMLQQCKGKPCILCGVRADIGVALFPDDDFAKKIGQPRGKCRVVVYPICSKCQKKKDASKRAEQEILADYRKATGNQQN